MFLILRIFHAFEQNEIQYCLFYLFFLNTQDLWIKEKTSIKVFFKKCKKKNMNPQFLMTYFYLYFIIVWIFFFCSQLFQRLTLAIYFNSLYEINPWFIANVFYMNSKEINIKRYKLIYILYFIKINEARINPSCPPKYQWKNFPVQ